MNCLYKKEIRYYFMLKPYHKITQQQSIIIYSHTHVYRTYLIGPYNAGPKSALFLRVALIRAGVNGAGVKRAIFKRKKNILEKSSVLKTSHIVC